jgi:hypothetical protein
VVNLIPIERDWIFKGTLDLRHLEIPAFELMVSSEPSSRLVSLLRSFNPDFLFHLPVGNMINAADLVLEWLKVRPTAQFININNVEIIF